MSRGTYLARITDPELAGRLVDLENTQLKIAYYAEITTTSGQISKPTGTTILLNQWSNGVDAVLSKIPGGAGNKPDFEDTGVDVTSFDTDGNFTLSGALPTSPSALIYYVTCPLSNYANLNTDFIVEQVQLILDVSSIETQTIQLKAISKTDQVVPTYPSSLIPVPEITQESNGITVDENGHISISKAGFYRAQIQLNLDNSNNTQLDTWAEYYNGSTWVELPDSGNVLDSGNAAIGNFIVETTLTIDAPLLVRIKMALQAGTATLKYDTANGAVGVPSCTFILYKVNPEVKGIAVETNNLTEEYAIGDEAGGNYIKIKPNGDLKLIGEATQWDDLSAQFIGANIDTGTGRIDFDYFNGGITFAANARYPEEPVVTVIQAKHAMLYGTGAVAKPHFHWLQEQVAIPNILLGYRIVNNGETTTKDTDFSNYTLLPATTNVFPYTSGVIQQITRFAEIDTSGLGFSGSLNMVLFRDSANVSGLFAGTDPVLGPITIKFLDSHVKFNGFGSAEELSDY